MFKKRSKKFWVITVVLVIVAIAALSTAGAVAVRIDTAKKGDMKEFIELRGKVDLDKKETVYSKISGIIKSIAVREGDQVEVNSELVKLDVQDTELALQKAQAAYDAARASLGNLRKSIKPEEVKQAEAQLEQSKIALDIAQRDYDNKKDQYDRNKALFESGAVSQQDLKDIETSMITAGNTLKDAQQKVSIVQSSYDMLKKGVASDAIREAEANAEQARLQVEELKNNKGRTSINSSIKGTVLKKYVDEGASAQPGVPLFDIGDNNSAYVRVDVLSDDASKIKIGQKAEISGEVLNDHKIQGEVYYIAPMAENSVSSLGVEQQRVEMRIRYDNANVSLKPGYGVDVDIVTQEKPSAVYVPDKVVFDMNGQDNVFVVKNGKAELRPVKTGIENDDYIEITEGLAEDDKIVVDPPNTLKPGMKVKNAK